MTQEQKDLWKDFFYNEWSHEFMKHIEHMIENFGKNLPISPSILALELSPNIKPEDILPEENFKLKIENAKNRILAPCGCRISWGHECEKPLMTCFAAFDRPRGEYYLNQPGRLLKEVSLEEAMEAAKEAERAGLVHWGDCYCCDSCCENLFPITRSKRYDLMTPNRFAAVVDEEKCNGCKKCEKRCYFEAIEFKPTDDPKKVKASVIPENCKGCGLCIITCKPNALRYEIVRPPEYLKPKPPEDGKDEEPPQFPVWGHYFLK